MNTTCTLEACPAQFGGTCECTAKTYQAKIDTLRSVLETCRVEFITLSPRLQPLYRANVVACVNLIGEVLEKTKQPENQGEQRGAPY